VVGVSFEFKERTKINNVMTFLAEASRNSVIRFVQCAAGVHYTKRLHVVSIATERVMANVNRAAFDQLVSGTWLPHQRVLLERELTCCRFLQSTATICCCWCFASELRTSSPSRKWHS